MDADRNIIPIVEGDQGEGMMDPLTDDDIKEAEQQRSFDEAIKLERRKLEKLKKFNIRDYDRGKR